MEKKLQATLPNPPQTPETGIFGPYWNGREHVYADPLAVEESLAFQLGGKLDKLIDTYNAGQQEHALEADRARAIEAIRELTIAARTAFEMAWFDRSSGTGAPDAQVRATLRAYLEWMEQKKSAPGESPTFAECLGAPVWSSTEPLAEK